MILYNEDVHAVIRRELRRVVDILVPDEDIIRVLKDDVLKRDALEGLGAEDAETRIRKADSRQLRSKTKASEQSQVKELRPVGDDEASLPTMIEETDVD